MEQWELRATEDVAALIVAIQRMLADEAVASSEELLNTGADVPASVCEVENLGSIALIRTDGRPDFGAHKMLAEAGYPVRCGERDSFGWLTGVIKTPKGDVVFG